jgi:hypothetical protein
MAAFHHVVPESPWLALALLFLGFLLCWWVYVPAHELLHAYGCIAVGGSVDRLEIDAIYGAAFLRQLFPFVTVGSRYAGQLTGFDTHGNDLIYLVTVFAPFLLSIFIGVPLMRRLARRQAPGLLPSLLFGVSLPMALAPFTNVVGDFYEMGSILVSRLARVFDASFPLERWRSDDLFLTANQLLLEGPGGFVDWIGVIAGSLVGLVLAFATYRLGRLVADRLYPDIV